MKITNSYEF